jgi:hypothetical protein
MTDIFMPTQEEWNNAPYWAQWHVWNSDYERIWLEWFPTFVYRLEDDQESGDTYLDWEFEEWTRKEYRLWSIEEEDSGETTITPEHDWRNSLRHRPDDRDWETRMETIDE